jgi:hypothetical protein
MIELPFWATRASFEAILDDKGFNQDGLTTTDYIPRKGSKYVASFAYGPFNDPSEARVMESRLLQAKLSGGIRVPLPLLWSQGNPGAPVVDGEVLTGRVLPIKGLVGSYIAKEGYWLSIEVSGQHYLHKVAIGGQANNAGELSITLAEMLRVELAGDEVIHLARPMIEGVIDAQSVGFGYDVNRAPIIEFAIKEKR